MSLALDVILERGYFPQELPPPFNTESLAKFVGTLSGKPLPFNTKQNRVSKPEIYNLARTGSLRRELSIMNPVQFTLLADCITKNWRLLEEQSSSSTLSLTKPILTATRAIGRQHSLDVLPTKRVELRSNGRFVLKADIIRFYSSVYTHSIPWALHGKAKAKKDHSKALLGNEIDELLRNCQDGQTNGIPVGPDTSFLIAELLLSEVDRRLSRRRLKGFRYIDDYELVFDSEPEALRALSTIEGSLLEFELHLNPVKTKIFPLPQRLEDSWVTELKSLVVQPLAHDFKKQLIRFFDRAFELERAFPAENVLKYAAGKMARMKMGKDQYDLAEDLLMQCARVEAGTLPLVLRSILRNPASTKSRGNRRKKMFHTIIIEHAHQRHSSEVAWSLWACIALKYTLPPKVVRPVLAMEDSICALLLLHARSLGLIVASRDLDVLKTALTSDNLCDNRWLLAYEANVKRWLPSGNRGDHVGADTNFGQLKSAGVSFYDESRTVLPSINLTDDEDEGERIDSYLDQIGPDYSEEEMDELWDDDEDEE